jgi:hypothetical protein
MLKVKVNVKNCHVVINSKKDILQIVLKGGLKGEIENQL